MVQIFNVRLGHANNSSSSHSIVFLDDPVVDDQIERFHYGWEDFTAASVAAKTDYLATALYQNLAAMCSEREASRIVQEWTGVRRIDPSANIDHQSHIALPTRWDGKGIDEEFFKEFMAYVNQDGLRKP